MHEHGGARAGRFAECRWWKLEIIHDPGPANCQKGEGWKLGVI